MEETIKTNSLKAWVLAARPVTLTAAAVPVLLGIVFAWRRVITLGKTTIYMAESDMVYTGMPHIEYDLTGVFNWVPAILCLLFAWVMQIDSNFVNDYFDCKKGADDETRLGPRRTCSQGWITMKAMKIGIAITTLIACIIGLPLVFYGGIEMVLVGITCVAFCFLYTTSLSYLGLGDVLVLMFFGIVPVCCTYYVCMPEPIQLPTGKVFIASIACGMVVDTLLLVNNYRGRHNDRKAGKMTMAVRFGGVATWLIYLHIGFFSAVIMAIVSFDDMEKFGVSVPLYLTQIIYGYYHFKASREMKRLRGKQLNKVLGMTARNILIFGLVNVFTLFAVTLFIKTPTW